MATQAYKALLDAKVRLEGETDEAYVGRFLGAAKEFVDAAGIKTEPKKYGSRLEAVDVADLMGDPDIEIAAPPMTMASIAEDTQGANEQIDAAIARVRNNAKVAVMALASAGGMAAGGAPAAAILPVVLGAASKLQ